MSCQEYFIETLHAKGYRLTPQRMAVLNVLHDLPGYITAEQVMVAAQRVNSEVDRATVYRTLELLESLEMVVSHDREGVIRRYALHAGQTSHFHLICTRCGQVMDASLGLIAPFCRDLHVQAGFVLNLGQLSLSGLCHVCSEMSPDS